MLEGLIILAIGAAIIVVALFGTSIMATIGAISASITAMVTGAITGTATLLTSWISWVLAADATTFYLGYIWFAGWIALFTYSAFKIATSDKKKWMNLVGRGSNYLGIFLILFLVAQPIAVSYGSAFMADTITLTEIDYNVTDVYNPTPSSYKMYTQVYNDTASTITNQALIFDNDTKEAVETSLDFAAIGAQIRAIIYCFFNSTFLAEHTVYSIKFDWDYVGDGNATGIRLVDSTNVRTLYETPTTSEIANSGSQTVVLETFQAQSLKSCVNFNMRLDFYDASNFPNDDGYVSFSVHFYEQTTLFTQEVLMLWLGVSMAALDIMGLLYASGFLSKYIL